MGDHNSSHKGSQASEPLCRSRDLSSTAALSGASSLQSLIWEMSPCHAWVGHWSVFISYFGLQVESLHVATADWCTRRFCEDTFLRIVCGLFDTAPNRFTFHCFPVGPHLLSHSTNRKNKKNHSARYAARLWPNASVWVSERLCNFLNSFFTYIYCI